jgi:hemerythrin
MENKQTAVEWLYNNLKSHFEHDGDLLEIVQFSFQQAKEMEKQQIIKTWYDCKLSIIERNPTDAEQYYNETFKQDGNK